MPEPVSQQPAPGHPAAQHPAEARPPSRPPQTRPAPEQQTHARPEPGPPQQQPVAPSTREDLRAVLAARRDLGTDYEDVLVDSFLDKLDVEIAARVHSEVAAQLAQRRQGTPQQEKKDSGVWVALGSLALGIPLTGAAGGVAGGAGVMLAWFGIVTVNVAYALGRRRQH